MKLNKENIKRVNNYLKDLLKECNKEKAEVELVTSLTNAVTEMNKQDKTIENETLWISMWNRNVSNGAIYRSEQCNRGCRNNGIHNRR